MEKNIMIAIEKYLDGEKYGSSISIAGYTTYGYGDLDENNFGNMKFQLG